MAIILLIAVLVIIGVYVKKARELSAKKEAERRRRKQTKANIERHNLYVQSQAKGQNSIDPSPTLRSKFKKDDDMVYGTNTIHTNNTIHSTSSDHYNSCSSDSSSSSSSSDCGSSSFD